MLTVQLLHKNRNGAIYCKHAKRIAELLEGDVSQVNVKATTTEKLGFTGREEGIAAQAVILLQKIMNDGFCMSFTVQ